MNKFTTTTTKPIVDCVCRVTSVTPLTKETFKVELQSPDDVALHYHAGQYLQLRIDLNDDGQLQTLSYSIANSHDPAQPYRLQLFIQNTSAFTQRILDKLSQLAEHNGQVEVRLPMGKAFLQTDLGAKHVLIAAGSGISKVKCITEAILRQATDADVSVYWSNKKTDDFYLIDEFERWGEQHKNINFTPILESAHVDWAGRSGYLYEVIEADMQDLEEAQTYLCGSPQMVYGTIDKLKASGLKEENCYSDVFEYAPRT